MKRKEVLIAVIGGCFGALLTMMVGLFSPVGVVAQSYNQSGVFNEITCRKLTVVDASGERAVVLDSADLANGVGVYNKAGKLAVLLASTDFGNSLSVYNKAGKLVVDLVSLDSGNRVTVHNKAGKRSVNLNSTEYGGRVDVFNNQGENRAVMSVNEYGNGAVSTWDKNGYRQ